MRKSARGTERVRKKHRENACGTYEVFVNLLQRLRVVAA